MLTAIFPANIQMLLNAQHSPAPTRWLAMHWLRLPLQAVLIWLV